MNRITVHLNPNGPSSAEEQLGLSKLTRDGADEVGTHLHALAATKRVLSTRLIDFIQPTTPLIRLLIHYDWSEQAQILGRKPR